MAPRLAVLATALFMAVSAAPTAAAERQVEALYKKVTDMHGCSERWASDNAVAECRKKIAAYRAAEAASDATADDLGFLVVERLKTQATLVAVLRTDGDLTAARKELEAAFKDLEAFAPGNTNGFALVQTLDLQRQAALLELADGSPARADAAIAQFRRHSRGFLSVLEEIGDSAKVKEQQRVNAVDAANFEMELGKHYAEMLEEDKATDKDAVRRQAIEAYESAREWAVARADNRWNGFAEKAPAVLYADASLELSKLAHDANDMTALATYVGQSKAVACVDETGDRYNDVELGERCMQSIVMEGWVTGANQALLRKISENNDEQMRAVVEMLRKKD